MPIAVDPRRLSLGISPDPLVGIPTAEQEALQEPTFDPISAGVAAATGPAGVLPRIMAAGGDLVSQGIMGSDLPWYVKYPASIAAGHAIARATPMEGVPGGMAIRSYIPGKGEFDPRNLSVDDYSGMYGFHSSGNSTAAAKGYYRTPSGTIEFNGIPSQSYAIEPSQEIAPIDLHEIENILSGHPNMGPEGSWSWGGGEPIDPTEALQAFVLDRQRNRLERIAKGWRSTATHEWTPENIERYNGFDKDQLDLLRRNAGKYVLRPGVGPVPGPVHELELSGTPVDYLRLDAPFSKQPEMLKRLVPLVGDNTLNLKARGIDLITWLREGGSSGDRLSPSVIARLLYRSGIKGATYKTGGTFLPRIFNYINFDPSDVVLKRTKK